MPKQIPTTKPRIKDKRVKLRVLLKNKRTCCVCHSPERPIQLHHIDGNRSNTTEANLAVLCLTHHDQATAGARRGQVGLGIKLTPDEVRAHKSVWERTVAKEHTVSRKIVPRRKRKQLQLLFEFELIKAKNEILTARKLGIVKARLDYLTEFLIEEFVSGIPYRKLILEAFSDIATRAAGAERVTLPLVSSLMDLHLHLVGPHQVRMQRVDENALFQSVDILDTVGFYGVLLARNDRVVRETCRVSEELAEIASWYGFTNLITRIKRILRRMEKEYYSLPRNEKKLPYSREKLRLIRRTLASLP